MKKDVLVTSISLRISSPPKNGIGHQGLLAGGSCRGVCTRYKAKIYSPSQNRYSPGVKYCSYCSIFLRFDGIFCLCCGRKVRHKRRHNNNNYSTKNNVIEENDFN